MDRPMPSLTFKSPIGPLTLTDENGTITSLGWGGNAGDSTPLLLEAERQLDLYFDGGLVGFDLPLAPRASPRLLRFLDALREIPYGETRTYGQMAKALGISAQAAGQACGANPIAILIPCHRVTGTGSLGGFSAPNGIEKKIALLKLEGAASLLL